MSTISRLSGSGNMAGLQSVFGTSSGRRIHGDAEGGASSNVKGTGSNFLRAIVQTLDQIGVVRSDSSPPSSSPTTSAADTAQDVQTAAQTFVQTLVAALHQAGSDNAPMPPPPPRSGSGPAYTKDQLTQMASELSSTDSKRANMASRLAANFDKADTNSDGKIDRREARAFDKASNPPGASAMAHYQGRSGRLEADINSLLQQLSSSDSISTNPALSNLQDSFQNLLGALGASDNQTSLDGFLQALANNLHGSVSTGNVVSTTA